jgi:hypothetical protein
MKFAQAQQRRPYPVFEMGSQRVPERNDAMQFRIVRSLLPMCGAILGLSTCACSSEHPESARSTPEPTPAATRAQTIVTVPFDFGSGRPMQVRAVLSKGRVMIDDMVLGRASDFGLDPQTGLQQKGAVCSWPSCLGDVGVWHDCDGIDYCFADGASCTSSADCRNGLFTCNLTKGKCEFTNTQKQEIANAFTAWAFKAQQVFLNNTRIKFNQKSSCAGLAGGSIRVNPDSDPSSSTCSGWLGADSGGNDLTLTPGCVSQNFIRHEIGHVLGLIHEHQRPNQDAWVSINYDAVDVSSWLNFIPLTSDNFTPYEYASVMHYGSWDFATGVQVPMIGTQRWSLKKNKAFQLPDGGTTFCINSHQCMDPWTAALSTSVTLAAAQVGRFDANDTDDVFVVDSGNWKYSPSATGSFVTLRASTVTTVNVGSYDKDGKRDDVVEFTPGFLKVYRNGNSTPTTILSGSTMSPVAFNQLVFGGDFNSDGMDDFVRASGTHLWLSWSNGVLADGTPKPYSDFVQLVPDTHPASELAVGNFDDDGLRDDLFATFNSSLCGAVPSTTTCWQFRKNLIDSWALLRNDPTRLSELKFVSIDIELATDIVKQIPVQAPLKTPGLQLLFNPGGPPLTRLDKVLGEGMPPVSQVLVGNFDGVNTIDILSRGMMEKHSEVITTSDVTAANMNVVCP